MDIGKAIGFVTEDERWVTKIVIGGLVAFLSLIFSFLIIPLFFLFAVYGYTVQVTRNVMEGVERPLPEWENWGKLFMDGLVIFVATVVYTLPVWLLTCCALLFIVPLGGAEGDMGDVLAGISVLGITVISCLILLFALALLVVSPAIVIQYARTDDFGACFRFSEVLGFTRDNIGDILIALLVIWGVSILVGFLAFIPLVGSMGQVYLLAVTGHLYGQIGAKAGGTGKTKEDMFAA